MPAGEPTWATVAVKNTGTDDVTWFHDGCARPVGVSGTMPSATWRSGIAQNGQAANFKQRLLERMPEAISISFAPESMTRVGRIGCADVGMSDTIHPGRTIKQRARWDGMAFLRLGLPPPGPLTLHGRAAYYSRGRNQPSETNEGVITLGGQVWISGGKDPAWLDPPEVIDAALTDPALVDWLEGQTLGNGVSEILWFDLKQTLWQVGTLEYGPERLHYVLVDPATGEIRGTVERHWDPGEDGYP